MQQPIKFLYLLLLGLVLPTFASAQPGPSAESPSNSDSADKGKQEMSQVASANGKNDQESQELLRKAGELFNQGQYTEAVRLLKPKAASEAARSLLDKAARYAAVDHLVKAEEFSREGYPNHALLHSLLASVYDNDNPFARQGIEKGNTLAQERIQYRMAVAVNVPKDLADVGDRLEAIAVEHLSRIKPANVSLVDPAALEAALREQNLSLSRLATPQARIQQGQLKGIDALMIFDVQSCKVSTNRETSYGTTKYVDGTKWVDNPKYAEAQAAVETALKTVEEMRSSVGVDQAVGAVSSLPQNTAAGATGSLLLGLFSSTAEAVDSQGLAAAETRLQSAQATLNATPQQIEVERWVTAQYPIYDMTAKADLRASLRLLDAATSSVLLMQKLGSSYEATDRYVEQDSARNIQGDALELPDNSVMREETVKRVAREVEKQMENAVEMHGKRFSLLQGVARETGNTRKSVEYGISYLFAYPDDSASLSIILSEIERDLGGEAELLSLKDLLRRHCGLAPKDHISATKE